MKDVTKYLDFMLVKVFAVLLLVIGDSLEFTLYEGDTCTLKDGRSAICTKLQECPTTLAKLQKKQIRYQNLETCSFLGTTAIICCEDRLVKFNPEPTYVITTETPGEIVFPLSKPGTIFGDKPQVPKIHSTTSFPTVHPFPKKTTKPSFIDLSLYSTSESHDMHSLTSSTQNPNNELNSENSSNRDNSIEYTPTPWVTTSTRSSIGEGPVSRITRRAVQACEEYEKLANLGLYFHIVGGDQAQPGEFPHMAAIGYKGTTYNSSYSFDCGGSLISDKFILTAAHCVNQVDKSSLKVLIGTIDTTNNDLEGLELGVDEIFQHPKYVASRTYHDVALLRLNQSIEFDNRKRPACLNTDLSDISENVRLMASGWGVVNTTTRTKTQVLLYTNLTSIDLQVCNTTHLTQLGRVRRYEFGLNEGQMCAYDKELKRDACQGDSGGPLQYKPNEKVLMYKIIGITSFGHGCATAIPSVYARVAYYLDWIEDIVWK